MPDVFISDNKDEPVTSPKRAVSKVDRGDVAPGSRSRLSAFCYYPDNVDFETRDKEEKIVLMLRQHPIVNVRWILITLAILFVPSVVKYFGILSLVHSGIELVVTLAWYLFAMVYALENFLDWYFNVYFVTNTRVIDVDFYNLIDKKVSDAELDKIQDISYTSFGVWRMLFGYGDVFVQTAAEVSEFDFLAVPNPERVVKIIDDLTPNIKSKP